MSNKTKLKKLYWQDGLSLREIADKLDLNYKQVYYRFRTKHNIPTHKTIWSRLEIEDQELRETLNTKYSGMKARTEGRNGRSRYKGLKLLSEIEFVQLCNENKDRILEIWNKYLESDRNLKYALSIDRIDSSLGYTKDNIQFVFNGFNSWKDELTPVEVACQDETYYFASPAEGARYFGWREDDIRETMRNEYNPHNIKVSKISFQELFSHCSVNTLYDYYLQYIA